MIKSKLGSKANSLIVQHNDLIEAYYDTDLTINELKLIRYAISMIKKNDSNFPEYTFAVKDFLKAIDVKGNRYHELILKLGEDLSKKRIMIQSKDTYGWFPWFSWIVYERGAGIVNLSFNPALKSFLLHLEENFTKYSFETIAPLKSSHTIRLFELLTQYESIGYRRIDLEDLRKLLGIENKYPNFKSIRQRILLRAQSEINEKTVLNIDFEPVKKGRKTVAVDFSIKKKRQYLKGNTTINRENATLEEHEEFLNEVQNMLTEFNICIEKSLLLEWVDYDIKHIKSVLLGTKNSKMEYPFNYLSKVLSATKDSYSYGNNSDKDNGNGNGNSGSDGKQEDKQEENSWIAGEQEEKFWKAVHDFAIATKRSNTPYNELKSREKIRDIFLNEYNGNLEYFTVAYKLKENKVKQALEEAKLESVST